MGRILDAFKILEALGQRYGCVIELRNWKQHFLTIHLAEHHAREKKLVDTLECLAQYVDANRGGWCATKLGPKNSHDLLEMVEEVMSIRFS